MEKVELSLSEQILGYELTIRHATEAADRLRKKQAAELEVVRRGALVEIENRAAVIRTLQTEIRDIAAKNNLSFSISDIFSDTIDFISGSFQEPDWNSSNCY